MRQAFLFWLMGAGSAFALEPPPPYFEDAAQDSQCIVWAYSRAQHDQIYSFDGTQWTGHVAPFEGNRNAMPAGVVKMADGAVACIWRFEDHSIGVTRQLGHASTVLGTCPDKITGNGMNVTPLADAQNRLWITGNFPEIYRADGKGGVTLMHEITPDELINPGNARFGYNNIRAIEDGHGRVWAWADSRSLQAASLRGVLLFTGDKAELRDPLPQYRGAGIRTIVRADDRHLWIALDNIGLYKIDIDTFELQRVPDPVPGAFSRVHEIFVDGGDTYAVAYLPDFQDTLWRWRDGQWSQIILHFDVSSTDWQSRSWLPIKEGLIIGSYGNGGAWFIPRQGNPAMFSWRSGFPFESFRAISRFADGTFFGICRNSQLFHGALSLPPHDQDNARIVELEPDRGMVFAATGHVWLLPENPPIALKEWDGFKWIDHDLPAGTSQPGEIHEDDQGRLWLFSQMVSIFDPRSGQWQGFPNLEAAYVALKDKPVRFLHDELVLTPQYSADHQRVAYRRSVIEINYFDGSTWHKWEHSQITGKENEGNAVGPPWFDEKGKLHVNMRNSGSWQMDDVGKWSKVSYVSHFPSDIWSEGPDHENQPVPPDGCVTDHPGSIAVDNLGTTWLTWQGELYKCIPGFCVKVFAPDEANPFHSGRRLQSAFVDPQGNAFLGVALARSERMMIRPKAAAPMTQIVMKRKGEDAFVAHFDAHTKETVTFRWQLDDGGWQLNKTDTLILEHLPNGPHVLKVTAVDDQLNMDATPATARFETYIDPKRQMALLMTQLFDPDYAKREAAVEALAEQSATALPALRKARETATDDQRWWIDAAIQECERNTTDDQAKPLEPPGK